ncbi:MAG: FKBP-type peptidyl-prolyl cis-trans isomerase [Pseudomonadota bacterium]|nr:FKBP-type peptidyl-prolyl cis-trans isomerase [Pseudomonadota bacterium]
MDGWDQGVARIKIGESRRLISPPELAYGDSGPGRLSWLRSPRTRRNISSRIPSASSARRCALSCWPVLP